MITNTDLFNLGFTIKTYLDDDSIDFKHIDRPYLLNLNKKGEVTSVHDAREQRAPKSFTTIERLRKWHENYETNSFFAKIVAERKSQ